MKCLIIGLDGATWRVLDRLQIAGYLPNIRRLVASGVAGDLMSTIPPVTALAWPTFMTGKNPGKHGVLSWQMPLDRTFRRSLTSGAHIQGDTLWDILGRAGLRLCIVNVPMTYPPRPVNGVLVSGMMTPGTDSNFTYPESLRDNLLSVEPQYSTDMEFQSGKRHMDNSKVVQKLLTHATEIVHMRGQIFRWLVEREMPDVGMLVFEMPDRLQHVLWDYIACLPQSLGSSRHAQTLQGELLQCFHVLDEEVGRLLELVDSNGLTVVLSDHGFGPMRTNLYVNDWLAQHGWLSYAPLRSGLSVTMRQLGRHFRKMLPSAIIDKIQKSMSPLDALDWQRTVAYSGIPTEYGIFLNVIGREPAGVVTIEEYEGLRSAILDALRNWRHPETGELIIAQAFRREDVYSGVHIERAPDILYLVASGYVISELTAPKPNIAVAPVGQEPWGFHEREGIIVFSGPQIRTGGVIGDGRIEDVMPTLIHALGLPIPDDIDGRVLLDAFDADWRKTHPIQHYEASQVTPSVLQDAYSASEVASLHTRLQNLGYLE